MNMIQEVSAVLIDLSDLIFVFAFCVFPCVFFCVSPEQGQHAIEKQWEITEWNTMSITLDVEDEIKLKRSK